MYITELLFRSFNVFLNITHKSHQPSTRKQIQKVDNKIETIAYFRNNHRGLSTDPRLQKHMFVKNKNNS